MTGVSERRQKKAQERVEAARERERKARLRARVTEEHGNPTVARLHRKSAELQADAASDAETLLKLDQQIEGDQLEK